MTADEARELARRADDALARGDWMDGWENHAEIISDLAHTVATLTVVLDEAYREDTGLTTWHEHPELELPQRHAAWLDEEERAGR